MSIYKRIRNGKESEYYYFKFEYQGTMIRQCSETADKKEALAREREARKLAIAGRWAEIRRMSMRRTAGTAKMAQVLTVYRARAGINHVTIRQNINALRTICAKAYPSTEFEELGVNVLTGKLVRDYKAACLVTAGENKLAIETAKLSCNSTYAQAKSIFNGRMLEAYTDAEIDLGDQIEEFRNQPMFPLARRIYQRPTDEMLKKILKMAFLGEEDVKPLKQSDPNAYKAFLLALGLGLRKNAAGHARYSWITEEKRAPIAEIIAVIRAQEEAKKAAPVDGKASQPVLDIPSQRVLVIRIEEDFQPKGKDEQSIPMDEFIYSELQALRVPTADPNAPQYIIHGHFTERCELVWRRLSAWMSALGWDRRMKAHELRKLYGAEVASEFGIYAAQKLLGHKDPRLTSARYASLTELPDVNIFGASPFHVETEGKAEPGLDTGVQLATKRDVTG